MHKTLLMMQKVKVTLPVTKKPSRSSLYFQSKPSSIAHPLQPKDSDKTLYTSTWTILSWVNPYTA